MANENHFAVFGVAVAPSVIEIISEQLSTAGFSHLHLARKYK